MLVFSNFVFQFSSIFCAVLAQTVEDPFFRGILQLFRNAVVLFKRDTIKPGDRPGYYSRPSNSLRSRSISFFNSSSLGR
jgi:hypothetical protein